MIEQVLFMMLLYISGVLSLLPIRERVPIEFIGISGFLWGMFIWMISNLLWLMVTGLPTVPGGVLTFSTVFVIILFFNFLNRTWRLATHDWLWCVAPLTAFGAIGIALSFWNLATSSGDTFSMIFLADTLALDGMTARSRAELLAFGPGLPLLQSMKILFDVDYIFLFQPLTAFSFVMIWCYLAQRCFKKIANSEKDAKVIALTASILLFTCYGFVFQYYYIHNTLHAALFLFVAVTALWLGQLEHTSDWFIIGIAGLIGFGLFRREAPLVIISVLATIVRTGDDNRRVRTWVPLVPTLLMLTMEAWLWIANNHVAFQELFLAPSDLAPNQHLRTVSGVGTQGLFSTSSALLQIISLIGFAVALIGTSGRLTRIMILRSYFQKILFAVLIVGLFAAVFWKPGFMARSLVALLSHLLVSVWWSPVTIPAFVLLLFSLRSRAPHSEIFSYSIINMIIILLIIRTAHSMPYHLGWGDSLNRMLTYIIPIAILYVVIKILALHGNRSRSK